MAKKTNGSTGKQPITKGVPTPAPTPEPLPDFITVGTETSQIDVRISYRIIELFSQGLYRSPNKAIEELVSNSFDAGATKVHIILSPDLLPADSTIAIIDNGMGMDEGGLRQHWLIGMSNKRDPGRTNPRGRKQIGRFGIGKLATYVLSNRLSHIAKCGGKYYATSMDYREIPPSPADGISPEDPVSLPLRVLTEAQAKAALAHWIGKSKPGYQEIKLFGKGAEKSWTVAILSNLKEMSREIQRGRLKWVLSTAMPLRDDFQLYFDGDPVSSAKLTGKKIETWVLGKDLTKLQPPAPDNLDPTEDDTQPADSEHRFGLTHPQLGRVTGYAELYEELLTGGKSIEIDRSHGFFVYVHGRLINIDDEYFGIDSNALRHGTFGRFRMVVHIDRLDEELRSSRESLHKGSLLEHARNILHGVFNQARIRHGQWEGTQAPGVRTVQRIAATPGSLSRQPLVALVDQALQGNYKPKYTVFPQDLNTTEKKADFLKELRALAETPEGIVREVRLSEGVSREAGIGKYDAATHVLEINALHPYVAHFLDEYDHKAQNVPLELLGMSEVLLEAHLFGLGMDGKLVHDALSQRDELLRTLSRSTGRRNARLVARALLDASTNQSALENEVVAAFDSMGFSNAVKIAGTGKPDGLAEAILAGTAKGVAQSYMVTLEAKSKERLGGKVSAKTVGVSGLVRHRDDYCADHSVVVGPDFPTTQEDESALGKEIAADRENNPGRGITLIRVEDLARLVRLVPAKRVGLGRLRDLFKTCSLPQEAKEWIDKLDAEKMILPPYKELLEAIEAEQKDMPNQAIEYGNIETRLRIANNLRLPRQEVIDLCKALSMMAPGYIFAREGTVELNQRPDKVLAAISATIKEYPEEEQKRIAAPK